MSSAGHVLDMIKRSRYNDSVRRKRTERMKDIKELWQDEIRKHNHIEFQRKNIQPEELQKIKERIRRRVIVKHQKSVIYTALTTLVFITIVIVLINLLL